MKHLIVVLCGMLIIIGVCTGCSSPSASASSSSTTQNDTLNVNYHSSCNSGTGQPTTCTLTLINLPSSTTSFDWSATSDPLGASFSPSSGSLASGATSDTIQISIPNGICPDKLIFVDSSHHTEVDDTITTACQ